MAATTSSAQRPSRRVSVLGRPLGRTRDRGSVTVEMVVLLPLLFGLMFVGVQAGLIHQARTLCSAAAQEGARAAARQVSSAGVGVAEARQFLDGRSNARLSAVTVTADRGAETAVVTVAATSRSVVPGWSPSVTQTASMPVERLTG